MTRWGQRDSSSTAAPSSSTVTPRFLTHRQAQDLEDLPALPKDFEGIFMQAAAQIKELADNIKEQRSRNTMQHFGGATGANASALGESGASGGTGHGRITEHVMVPAHRAGLVIGHHGESLKRIEKQSQCKVQFDQQYNHSDSTQRRVIITGYPEDVEEAKRLIAERVEDPMNRFPTVQIKVPQSRVGLVIGKGGETIRELQEKSGAKITVQPESQMDPWTTDRLVSITGDEESIARAKDLINDLVAGQGRMGGGSGVGGVGAPPVGPNVTVIFIPETSVGAVIGKRAETLRTLQSISGCRIFVEQQPQPGQTSSSAPPGMRSVHLTGAPEQVAYAQQLIMERVAQNEGSYYGGYGYDSSGQQPSVIYQNPAELAGGYDYSQYYHQAYAQPGVVDPQQPGATYDYAAAYAQYYGLYASQQPPQQ